MKFEGLPRIAGIPVAVNAEAIREIRYKPDEENILLFMEGWPAADHDDKCVAIPIPALNLETLLRTQRWVPVRPAPPGSEVIIYVNYELISVVDRYNGRPDMTAIHTFHGNVIVSRDKAEVVEERVRRTARVLHGEMPLEIE